MKKPNTKSLKLVEIRRASGVVEVLAIPKTARLTIYAGRVGKPGPEGSYQYGAILAAGGQLRVYVGNQLIGFFPDVIEMHVTSDMSRVPIELPPIQPGMTYESLERSESSPFQGAAKSFFGGVSSQAKKGLV